MDLEMIKERVANIKAFAEDPEKAHALEDDLYKDFVRFIVLSGSPAQRAMARAVLETQQIKFSRWYA